MPRILFVAMHRPRRNPSQRFRFEQYIPALEAAGFACELSYLVSATDDPLVYAPGRLAAKARIFAGAALTRLRDVLRARAFDVVVIHREAMFVNWAGFERLFAAVGGTRLVFDFDDAIWEPQETRAGGLMDRLRAGPSKLPAILARMDLVLAGNAYLADYARRYAARVEVMPTTLDTDHHGPVVRAPNAVPVIGWSGSFSTVQYLDALTPVLARVRDALGGAVEYRVFGDERYRSERLGIAGRRWVEATEVADTAAFDVGLMPLPDDRWTRGKCGFKALLYMSLGLPAVVSPVGVNAEIVEDGVNGFVAGDDATWEARLTLLARDPGLRARLGAAGRVTVVERYSLAAWRDRYVGWMREMAGG